MNSIWGIIGVGQLGACVAEGILRSQASVNLCLSPRSEWRVRELAANFPVTVAEDNQSVIDGADHVLLAVGPRQLVEVVRDLRFRSGQVVVSLAAALPHGRVRQAVGPATAVRAMPVLSAASNESPTCVYPENHVTVALFEHLGAVHVFDDENHFAAAAVAATYYGWMHALMDVPAGWLEANGISAETSRKLIAQMTRAAASRCLRSGDNMRAMATDIARPGTFTALGLELLDERGALATWTEACQRVLDACRERGR